MKLEIKGIHYDISDNTKEFIEKKLQKIEHAKESITDLVFSITKEKHGYKVDVNINFPWGISAHIGQECFELFEGLEKIIDKIGMKVHKEKDKKASH